jgi:hypothetical protein
LSEIERASQLLAPEKQGVQKLSVIHHLPELARDFKIETVEKLFPKILVTFFGDFSKSSRISTTKKILI